MLALSLGLAAAILWAIHDLLTRKLSQGAALVPMIFIVLLSGSATLVPAAWLAGGFGSMTANAVLLSTLSGVAFAAAIGSLYKAFSMAPARIVSPVIGAYPLLSLGIALLQGRPVMLSDWASVLVIVIGIAIVAHSTRSDAPEDYGGSPGTALRFAAVSSVCFATTFAFGQEATRQGAELPVMLIGRLVAVAIYGLLLIKARSWGTLDGRQIRILSLMGAIDAIALGLVTASGSLPQAEYAAVSSSLFGVLTVIFAAWILRERVRLAQGIGIAAVFAGVLALGLSH